MVEYIEADRPHPSSPLQIFCALGYMELEPQRARLNQLFDLARTCRQIRAGMSALPSFAGDFFVASQDLTVAVSKLPVRFRLQVKRVYILRGDIPLDGWGRGRIRGYFQFSGLKELVGLEKVVIRTYGRHSFSQQDLREFEGLAEAKTGRAIKFEQA